VARPSPGTTARPTGYTAFLGLDLHHHKAVVVCADVARVTDNLGNQLLA